MVWWKRFSTCRTSRFGWDYMHCAGPAWRRCEHLSVDPGLWEPGEEDSGTWCFDYSGFCSQCSCMPLSFFTTKNKLEAAGEVDSWMKPCLSASLMYSSMVCVSRINRGYILPLGSVAPGTSSMAHSHGRWKWPVKVKVLLPAACWTHPGMPLYSSGTLTVDCTSGLSMVVELRQTVNSGGWDEDVFWGI